MTAPVACGCGYPWHHDEHDCDEPSTWAEAFANSAYAADRGPTATADVVAPMALRRAERLVLAAAEALIDVQREEDDEFFEAEEDLFKQVRELRATRGR